jgi:hypothetical protein
VTTGSGSSDGRRATEAAPTVRARAYGDYQLLALLAEGGMGSIHLARRAGARPELAPFCVVKRLRRHRPIDRGDRELPGRSGWVRVDDTPERDALEPRCFSTGGEPTDGDHLARCRCAECGVQSRDRRDSGEDSRDVEPCRERDLELAIAGKGLRGREVELHLAGCVLNQARRCRQAT